MSVRKRNEAQDDLINNLLNGLGRLLSVLGGLAFLVGLGFLVFYFQRFGQPVDAAVQVKDIERLVGVFGDALLYGGIVLCIGLFIQWWGEEILGPLMLILGGGLFFAPMYLPSLFSGSAPNTDIPGMVLQRLQTGGTGIGLLALIAIGADVVTRVHNRVKYGSKADALKYGKGIKEEDDVAKVFLGKCWQLPYCRKFVRERCPIYHARRTCWKERVGCMCEESVIANAMSGTAIPRDVVAAAKFIPYNTRLTPANKAERCRNCVIYNERQRQKYKVVLPGVLLAMLAFYVLFREPMKGMVAGVARQADRFLGSAALSGGKTGALDRVNDSGFIMLQEVLVVGFVLMGLAYLLKFAEFLVFKLKI